MKTLYGFSVVYLVPGESLSVRLDAPDNSPVIGQPLGVKCCTNLSVAVDITSPPTLQWYKDGQALTKELYNLWTTSEEEERCLTLSFTALRHQHLGEYVCRAKLQSLQMVDILVREEVLLLTAGRHSISLCIL